MRTLTVTTAHSTYDIHIGHGLLARAGKLTRAAVPGAARACIVTDSNVAPLWLSRARAAYEGAGFAVSVFVFPAGEANKQLSVIAEMYTAFAGAGLTRSDVCVALGGGVTGDMTGFAAATWLRGIAFVQLPTSLLAQVDSSVGGKTGVDIPAGKNLVGAFHQPRLVVADLDTLSTLPPAYFTDGTAEIIKAGCILDAGLFAAFERGEAMTAAALEDTVTRAVAIKRDVVQLDETEQGLRRLLNFGHTLGHALETHYHYETLSHGCAVAIGSAMITRASERQGLTAPGTADRLERVLAAYGLPTADEAPLSAWLHHAGQDKKRRGGDLSLVLLRDVGEAFVHTLPWDAVPAFLEG